MLSNDWLDCTPVWILCSIAFVGLYQNSCLWAESLFGNTDWLEHTFLWSQPTNNFDHKWMFEIICQSTQTKSSSVYQGWRPRPTEEMSRFSRGFGSDLCILGSGSNPGGYTKWRMPWCVTIGIGFSCQWTMRQIWLLLVLYKWPRFDWD